MAKEHRRSSQRQTRLLAYARAIALDPFRADPEAVASLPAEQRERGRRASLLRLVLISITVLALVIVIPPALIYHLPANFIIALFVDVALSIACLLISRLGFSTTAGVMYVIGGVALGTVFVRLNASGLNDLTLLVYAVMTSLILIAGLVLPPWMIWPTLLLVTAATVFGIWTTPLAPYEAQAPDAAGIRLAATALLMALQTLAALVSWASALSARAGLRGAVRAYELERELAALKDQFIIDANHELRTPIMALYGNVELLRSLGENGSSDARARLLARAMASGESVLTILSNVLDAGRLDSDKPKLTLAPVRIEPVVRAVLETFDPREIGEPGLEVSTAGTRPVAVEVAEGLTVLADEHRLRQVLINLLSNALKYSEPGTPIEIRARAQPPKRPMRRSRGGGVNAEPGEADISVRDYGLGVPSRDRSKLFNRFVRLERDIAGPVRGNGVGLYLCRTLIEAMGGRIWVESSGVPGEGSTFGFTLPIAAEQPEALSSAAPDQQPQTGPLAV